MSDLHIASIELGGYNGEHPIFGRRFLHCLAAFADRPNEPLGAGAVGRGPYAGWSVPISSPAHGLPGRPGRAPGPRGPSLQATLHEDRLFVAGFGTIGAALSPHDEARLRGLLLARAARVFRALDEFFASTVPKGWLPDSASGLKVSELRFNPRGGDGFLLPTNLEAQAFLLPKPGARRSGAHVIWTDKGAVLGMSGFGLSSSGPSQVVGPHQARIEFSRLYGPAAGPAILADLATIGPRVNALGRALLATLS